MKTIRFTFLVDKEERKRIREVASSLQRSQGDAMRFLLKNWKNNANVSIDNRKKIIQSLEEK